MEPQLIAIALALAALVGVSLGLLGGGGSILTVPILTYVLGMPPREAIAASLFIVGATSAVSMIGHAKAGRVRWKTGLLFGVAGMAGAFAGGILGGYIPGAILMVLFAVMMIITATAMIRGRNNQATKNSDTEHKPAEERNGRGYQALPKEQDTDILLVHAEDVIESELLFPAANEK